LLRQREFVHTMIDRLDHISRMLAKGLAALAGFFLTAMMLLACANMVSRTLWLPIPGTYELMGFFGAVVTGFALAFAQLNKSHISVGLLMKRLPKTVRRTLDALTSLASCVFFALIGLETGQWAGYLVRTGELSETLRIAYHPFVFATALGCLAMAFVLLVDVLKTISGRTEH